MVRVGYAQLGPTVTRAASFFSATKKPLPQPTATTTASPSPRGPLGVAGVPSRNSLPYVSRAAGHLPVSTCTAGAGGPTTEMVPSTLPVGPLYSGTPIGLSTASTLSLGTGK